MTRIGKYHILEEVGEGAMGIVYRATDPVLNRTVAIKVMSEGIAENASLRERFLREAQAAGSLQHPNVVIIYDFGETDGHLFIAMEFIEGVDLEHLLKQGEPLSLATKLGLIIDVLNGLSYAHRRGIIHRDIKPANIRVDQEGRARIMDFGVARLSSSHLTHTGIMMGTPNYMAPEQITGGELTPAVDLFAVGAMLFELLSNTKPFGGDTLHNVLYKIVSVPTPELSATVPGMPSALSEIVRKALAKEPKDRYQTAVDMANALSAVRADISVTQRSKRVSQRVSLEGTLHVRPTVKIISPVRQRWRMAAAGAVALLAVSALAVFAFRKDAPVRGAAAPLAATDTALRLSDAALPAPAAVVAPPTQRPADAAQQRPVQGRTDRPSALPPPVASRRQSRAPETSTPSATDVTRTRDTAATTRVTQQAPPSPTLPVAATGQAPVAAPAPAVAAPPAPSTAAAADNARTAIVSVINAYAQAIGTRDVAEIRRVYPGMTTQQQSAWESFFSSLRVMKATFEITSLDPSSAGAVARFSGLYEYVTRAGRSERQPVSFEALFRRDGDRWTLQTVR